MSSPLRIPPCALLKEGKERDMTVLKRKRLLMEEEHAHIYMNINKGYHPMKFEGSGSKGTFALLSGNSFYSSGHRDLDL